jgi:hypothetical protein
MKELAGSLLLFSGTAVLAVNSDPWGDVGPLASCVWAVVADRRLLMVASGREMYVVRDESMMATPFVPIERMALEPLAENDTPAADDAVWPGSCLVGVESSGDCTPVVVVGSGTKTTLELLMSMTIGSGVFAVDCAVLSCDRALWRTESALSEPLVVGSAIAVLWSMAVFGSAEGTIGS